MIRAGLVAAACLVGTVAVAGLREEEHIVGDVLVRIDVVDTVEIMTVGPNDQERMQVLSGADIEILAFAGDPDSVTLLGEPVLVATVFATHSCDAGDALAYHVVRLSGVPAPGAPAATCGPLEVGIAHGAVFLEKDPMRVNTEDGGETWRWTPEQGFTLLQD